MGVLFLASSFCAKGNPVNNEALKLLPEQIGSFRAVGPAIPMMPSQSPHLFGEGSVTRDYAFEDGSRNNVQIQTTENDSEAFALLTQARSFFHQFGRDAKLILGEPGTASFKIDGRIFFFKGNTFASVTPTGNESIDHGTELARQLAAQLNGGEGEIPVLVKHLPDWETASRTAVYCVTLDDLKNALMVAGKQNAAPEPQPVIDAISFDGGAEAVAASYGQSQLVIVEFTTPQLSIDNDSRIWTKIAELKANGQPAPTAYRRVGNYSIFVFNAPDEKTANALVEQVKYEQVVQWLGDDPHLAERLQRYFTQTSAGVLVAVLKSSGLSLVLCLAIGGLIGAMLFRHRRAQRAAAYSDAGGSIRLNLDELTEPVKTGRLLKSAEPPEQPSANS